MSSSSPPGRSPRLVVTAVLLAAVALAVAGYLVWDRAGLPVPGSALYEQYVEAFQVGVAALDAGVPQVAEENLTRAIELVPKEPAAWADRGLLYLRTGRLPEAAHDIEQAHRLAPDEADVLKLVGLHLKRSGRFGESVVYLRRSVERDPQDIEALFMLAQIVAQEQQEGNDAEYQRLMEQILAIRPENLRVLNERLRVAVRRSDVAAARDTFERLKRMSPNWSKQAREQLASLDELLAGPLGPDAVKSLFLLDNVLKAEPGYAKQAGEVSKLSDSEGRSLQSPLRLAPVRSAPALPDTLLSFTPEPAPGVPEGHWSVVLPVWLTSEGGPALFVADAHEVRRAGDELPIAGLTAAPSALVPLDWNNDQRTDLLLVGPDGLQFLQQEEKGGFADVTTATGLPEDVLRGDYRATLAADVDLDGDLDIVVAAADGPPLFLRNNFDGEWTPQPIFVEVHGPRSFAWADFDHDGTPDAALLDASGKLHVFANDRSAAFIPWPSAPPNDDFLAITATDANDDCVLDLVALRNDGALVCISDAEKRSSWNTVELARSDVLESGRAKAIEIKLLSAADLDNNGALDLLVSGPDHSAIWLGRGGGKFEPLAAKLPPRVAATADLDGLGRLDLVGLDDSGRALRLRNAGRGDYHWQTVRPQAATGDVKGDNRINSFGVGGEIELRTGTHVVKQLIAAPVVHFGLGERSRADVVRIVWPNGTFQVEFNTPIDKAVVAVQRLKGSCPFLFAWDGTRFAFVTDFMWSTPLGMYINAADKGGLLQTTDWVKIPGERLVARDGTYELRVNANLWETHFFDQLALVAVDHPADTELFVDERFFLEPTEPTMRLTGPPRSVARAWDHEGRDATDDVRSVDGVYLDRCGRGVYQGVTQDHWVEVDLGDDAVVGDGPLWLLARGWVHPTDSSINYALEQGKHDAPRGLVLEVPDGHGGWKVARDKLGFPAGKNKTIMVRLDELDGLGVARHFRLRTNMEIYWDALQYARGRDDAPMAEQRLLADRADLRFRGIVAMTQENSSSPELPDYDQLAFCGQFWRDLIGFHTRYGDVGELLREIDDRYAILCGGDEIVLRYAVPAGPPDGWRRDFVWVSDGWVKDGDYNTRFGKTVLPLPAHDLTSYDAPHAAGNTAPPGRLEDDPVYRRHPRDWEVFHTRYVTTHAFERGLRGFHAPPRETAEPNGSLRGSILNDSTPINGAGSKP
ncbi:MAG TPA: FG-GAP-like repeat-containing protein [Pirellulales bacterium]|nr:FG-GAP-like repeat-containing protein [Pirellulales bacterium]